MERLQNAALLKETELAHWFELQRQSVLQAAEAPPTLAYTEILLSRQQNTTAPEYRKAYNSLSNHFSSLTTFAASDSDISILTNGGIIISQLIKLAKVNTNRFKIQPPILLVNRRIKPFLTFTPHPSQMNY